MQPSARVQYALLALMEIASQPDPKIPLTIVEITNKQPIPDRYLEQILTHLRRSGIIQSQRGAKGGYVLSRAAWQITLLEIINSVEGDQGDKSSSLSTSDKKLIHEVWQQAQSASQSVLSRYTLQDLCLRRDAYLQTNPMYHI